MLACGASELMPQMRIAQVAPLYESVPPRLYGGTERVVSYLTEELVALGHSVTLFASGDSNTTAELVPAGDRALRLNEGAADPLAPHLLMLEDVVERAGCFDAVHFHTDVVHLPLARRLPVPHVTTLHGRLDLPWLQPLYAQYSDVPVISISSAQSRPLPGATWAGTVLHGLPQSLYQPGDGDGGYLAFLGRISPEKRVDRAIDIAVRSGMRLCIAAKVDAVDHRYFAQTIEPLLDHPLVNFIGEIGEDKKQEFLGRAAALLFPIDWDEPFGLVMIESMACGTPVVAFDGGSVREVLEDGVTGFIVQSVEEATVAVPKAIALDRQRCRAVFDERFTSRRMAEDYLSIYRSLTAEPG